MKNDDVSVVVPALFMMCILFRSRVFKRLRKWLEVVNTFFIDFLSSRSELSSEVCESGVSKVWGMNFLWSANMEHVGLHHQQQKGSQIGLWKDSNKTRQMRKKFLRSLSPLSGFSTLEHFFCFPSTQKKKMRKKLFHKNVRKKYHFSLNQDVLTENCSTRWCTQQFPIIIKGESQKHLDKHHVLQQGKQFRY